ncbi:MAG TPA: UbiA family prenyltransferase, partial [Candidatus Sulfotelmatobacter sp.]|nr:UbiA family prenyltransferase [Candidatus Sulfotelmatobacter sp.]
MNKALMNVEDSVLLLVDHQSSLFHTTKVPVRRRFAARLPSFVALMKPRVMSLAVFTAFVGLTIAPGHLDPLLGSLAIVVIAAGAGAAGALNMWYEADIDALMARTVRRPIPRGEISRAEALVFGLIFACSAVAVLALALNIKAAALLAFAIFFYVVVYTMWLKRQTPQNIVIGGAAGALPPVIGWTAARAGLPMLPVVAGRIATTRQTLIYSVLLLPISLLPCALGFGSLLFGTIAVSCGAIFVALAFRLHRSKGM